MDKTTIINKPIEFAKEKNSGAIWIAIAIALILVSVPLIIYGIYKATSNGIVWVSKGKERRLGRLENKKDSILTKQTIEETKREIAFNKQKHKNLKNQNEQDRPKE